MNGFAPLLLAPLLLGQAVPVAAGTAQHPVPLPVQPPAVPMPPADWSTLPPLRYRHAPDLPPAVGAFVQGEVAAGRCPAPPGHALRVEVAVLVGAGGATRVVPRAIGCPTVEQYASGLVSRLARDNVEPDGTEGWHVTRVDLSWPG